VTLTREQLVRLARLGAERRLQELDEERKAIEAFVGRPSVTTRAVRRARKATAASPKERKRRGWTPAQRKAAAERMKAHWAARRAGRKK
jgi:hypothetical protein